MEAGKLVLEAYGVEFTGQGHQDRTLHAKLQVTNVGKNHAQASVFSGEGGTKVAWNLLGSQLWLQGWVPNAASSICTVGGLLAACKRQQLPPRVASAAWSWVTFLEAAPLVRHGSVVLPISF